MNSTINICLEQKKEFMYCYFQCDKICPTVNKLGNVLSHLLHVYFYSAINTVLYMVVVGNKN